MKKNKLIYTFLLSFFLSIFMFTESKAQNTFTGDVLLETQAEVITFGANNYTDITGNLTIQESAAGTITDLTPLLTLTSITGNLNVSSSGISNLNGLNNITAIGGDLTVGNTVNITNIDELSNLTFVGNSIIFTNCTALTNVDGFSGIQEINGNLNLNRCNALTNVQGLINIITITGDLKLFQLRNLINYDGFMNLTSIGGSLDIQRQELLNNIDGFKNLTSIGGYFEFRINPFITNLDGLSKVATIGGNLNIVSNASLNSFCGLFNVLNSGGLAGTFGVGSNLTNPTMAEIIADGTCNSSTVCVGDVLLTTQAEVDAFNCTEITGNLTIQESSPGNITDLSPLSTLTSIGGSLFLVLNTSISSLAGLENLTNVEGGLFIQINDALTNLNGLSSIATIGGNLQIDANQGLLSIDGLNSIKSIGGDLQIFNNRELQNVNGLSNLVTVGGFIYLEENTKLINLDGLSNVTTIGTGIRIVFNSSLGNIDGLSNITATEYLEIRANPLITNIDGLNKITTVNDLLVIFGNDLLTNLDGLSKVSSIGGNLNIGDNTALNSFCGLFTLLNGGGLSGTYNVTGNLTNPTMAEIIADGPCGGMTMAKTISYNVTLPDCDNFGNDLVVTTGSFKEGESFTFPAYQVPSQYSAYQPYYNAFVNAEFGIPEGSLTEDIQIVINLEGICENGLIDNPETKEFLELFFLSVEIIGENSGTHSPFEYYYFENEKEAYLKLMQENLAPIMDLLNFDTDELIPFFTVNGLNPDFEGIRKVEDATYYTIYARHFSEVKLGVPTSITDVDNFINEVPTEYSLNQNYPNPFNPSTSISYSIPSDGQVTLAIYDVLGNEVAVLENGNKQAGNYTYNFYATNLSSGLYFYTIKSGQFVATKKMLLMK